MRNVFSKDSLNLVATFTALLALFSFWLIVVYVFSPIN